jgi:polyisoprenyl-phosphate glycosyltransferase
MKLITIVTPCFNEQENIEKIYQAVKAIFKTLPQYRYEHLFIDNASTDGTVESLKRIAQKNKNLKIIVNTRNFGGVRSHHHGLLSAQGDAVIFMAADFQDPPDMIPLFLKEWESGYKVVAAVKPSSQESKIMFAARRLYYRLVTRMADVKLIQNFTGFGLYDKKVIEILRTIEDPYPYFRGLISEIGFDVATVPFEQPKRARGISSTNFYSLYDFAMLGITSHSKVPLRIATMLGFLLSSLSLLLSLVYLILKLIFWNHFALGTAPIIISIFFFSAVQLFFIGLLGEYISMIHMRLLKRPLVVEKERINFETEKPRKNKHGA